MSSFLFANDFSTTLANPAGTTDTTLYLTSITNFPTSIPTGYKVPLTLLDAATKTIFEIVYVTSIAGTIATVERAQEGTSAVTWQIGDYIACVPTAQTDAPAGAYVFNGFDGSNVSYKTASVTLTVDESGQIIDTSGFTAAGTLSLPATPVEGNFYSIIPNSTYQITISPNGGSFIFNDGTTTAASYVLSASIGKSYEFFWTGSYWEIKNNIYTPNSGLPQRVNDTGSVNALVVTLDPIPISLPKYIIVQEIVHTNTGPATINPNGLGAIPIVGSGGQPLQGNELLLYSVAGLVLNTAGTYYFLVWTNGGNLPVQTAQHSYHAVNYGQVIGGGGVPVDHGPGGLNDRTLETIYQNTTSRPLVVSANVAYVGTTNTWLYSSPTTTISQATGPSSVKALSSSDAIFVHNVIIPPSWYYIVRMGSGSINTWFEY